MSLVWYEVCLPFSFLFPFYPPLCCLFLLLGNPSQISRVPVAIKVLDVNDNAPELVSGNEAYLCENGKTGKVNMPWLSTLCSPPPLSLKSLDCLSVDLILM